MFQVRMDEDSVYLMDGDEELVMWTQDEWKDDPSLVLNIVNAVKIGYEQGSEAIREHING